MILLSYPIGNVFSREAALGLEAEELLAEFWTCVNWRRGSLADRLLPAALTRQLRRRALPPSLQRGSARRPGASWAGCSGASCPGAGH